MNKVAGNKKIKKSVSGFFLGRRKMFFRVHNNKFISKRFRKLQRRRFAGFDSFKLKAKGTLLLVCGRNSGKVLSSLFNLSIYVFAPLTSFPCRSNCEGSFDNKLNYKTIFPIDSISFLHLFFRELSSCFVVTEEHHRSDGILSDFDDRSVCGQLILI